MTTLAQLSGALQDIRVHARGLSQNFSKREVDNLHVAIRRNSTILASPTEGLPVAFQDWRGRIYRQVEKVGQHITYYNQAPDRSELRDTLVKEARELRVVALFQ
jgi:hypothetical protein